MLRGWRIRARPGPDDNRRDAIAAEQARDGADDAAGRLPGGDQVTDRRPARKRQPEPLGAIGIRRDTEDGTTAAKRRPRGHRPRRPAGAPMAGDTAHWAGDPVVAGAGRRRPRLL